MDVILHLGAHRTGTTSLQAWMLENEDLLRAAGIACWGPQLTRAGLFEGLIKRPDRVTDPVERAARASAARIRMEIDRLAEAGLRALLISEENVLGAMPQCLEHRMLYPDLAGRIARVLAAFGPHLTGLAISVRRYDMWWASVIAAGQARGVTPPDARGCDRLASHPRSWKRVVQILREASALPVTVLPFEGFVGRHEAQLAAMLPGAALPAALYDHGRRYNGAAADHGENGRFMPFSLAQRGQMTARYLEDLAWLRAPRQGVTFIENGAGTPGGYPGAAAEEEGGVHDHQERGLG